MIKLKISKREKIDNLGVARWWELIMHEGGVRERYNDRVTHRRGNERDIYIMIE